MGRGRDQWALRDWVSGRLYPGAFDLHEASLQVLDFPGSAASLENQRVGA